MELAVDQNRTVGIPHNTILVRRDGTEISVEDSVSPIHDRGGKVTGAVIVFRDVSALRAMTQHIAHSAQHDTLTNLPNRSLLNDRIGQAIALARRHNHRAAILFLDLNGFKHINDSLGHLMGDKLIQSVAARLSKHMRGPDTVSRQGGDEFIVLLSEVREAADAAITARRLVRDMEAPHSIDSHELYVTASIGISVYPDDGTDAETLIKNADTAMYQVKENVHAGFQFFKPAMNLRAVERQFLEENLRRALSRDEMALHYQPKINLKTGKIIGAEALLRWTHHDRGSISPAEFIPVAEESSLILSIGLWVVRQACKQAQDWAAAGIPDMNIAVNVSSVQLRNQEFLPKLFEILDKTGVDPKLLGVEVTEGLLMKRADFTSVVLQQLRERGIKVAIDDFGTGYSSLSYLHKFPLDTLKIDQSFVRQIASTDGSSIVSAIISMGRDLGLRIVAEGVETREELAFLKAQKCDEAQGYYFSRPVPADAFTALLRAPAQAWAN
jgi:diguanylate cyclase (GGDEF)-like protein